MRFLWVFFFHCFKFNVNTEIKNKRNKNKPKSIFGRDSINKLDGY